MKKCLTFFVFLFLLGWFLFSKKPFVFAQYACNASCVLNPAGCVAGTSCIGGVCRNPTCPLITNCTCPSYACNVNCSLYPGGCVAGTSCISNVCRNPNCTAMTTCTCPNYTIKGSKVRMPGNITIEPFSSRSVTIDGGSPTTTNPYSFTASPINHTVAVSVPSGSSVGYTLCYNNTTCHSNLPTAGSSVAVSSNQAINGSTNYADLWWHFTPLVPNCKNISVPSSVLTGDSVTVSADYVALGGPMSAASMYLHSGVLGSNCDGASLTQSGSSPPNYSFSWTSSAPGSYLVYCRAVNNAVPAECRGDCYSSGPPIYPCNGADNYGSTTSTTITVSNPGQWYKLKNLSLYKFGDVNISVPSSVILFAAGDPDDTGERFITIGNAGVGTAANQYNPGPSYNPIEISDKNWRNSNYSFSQVFVSGFADYVKSRKESIAISSIAEASSNAIYTVAGPLTLVNADLADISNTFVLIVSGDVTINGNFNNSSTKNLAILSSGKITFSKETQYANGVFIGQQIIINGETPAGSDTIGLKIKGNLVSASAFENNRDRADSGPSLFVVFDSDQYLNLLSLLSVAKYDWQQTQ